MKKDYSEFQYDNYDRYRAIRENTRDMRLDYFHNTVSLSEEKKLLYIRVDRGNEYETMQSLLDEYAQKEAAERVGEIQEDDPEALESERLDRIESRKENLSLMEDFIQRYEGKIRFGFEEEDSPDSDKEPLINVLSGAFIRLGYGEGILDFLYADFDTPLTASAFFYEALLNGMKEQFDDLDLPGEPEAEKVYSHTQEIVEDFLDYSSNFITVRNTAYRSLYTAICPPLFVSGGHGPKRLLRYRNYLLALQEEYKTILEFCYDENFHPNLLGHMMPHERYALYRATHDLPSFSRRQEQIHIRHREMGHMHVMPYGLEKEEIVARLMTKLPASEEELQTFAAELGLDQKQLYYHLHDPFFIRIEYAFSTVEQILELEFTKMLEQNVRFRKCKRCGKYFIMKGNYDTNYCDRVAEGSTQTCQQIAAQENYKARNADNKAIPIYSKYYKRYAARVRVNQIKEKDFNAWRYQAIVKRDECTDGKITPEELTEWMEASFPNRKPRKPKEEKE